MSRRSVGTDAIVGVVTVLCARHFAGCLLAGCVVSVLCSASAALLLRMQSRMVPRVVAGWFEGEHCHDLGMLFIANVLLTVRTALAHVSTTCACRMEQHALKQTECPCILLQPRLQHVATSVWGVQAPGARTYSSRTDALSLIHI